MEALPSNTRSDWIRTCNFCGQSSIRVWDNDTIAVVKRDAPVGEL